MVTMKGAQLDKIRKLLEEGGLRVMDMQPEHSQNGFYVALWEGGGIRFVRGTWLTEYPGGQKESCAVLYRRGECEPIGHGYSGRGWIERFCEDAIRTHSGLLHAVQ